MCRASSPADAAAAARECRRRRRRRAKSARFYDPLFALAIRAIATTPARPGHHRHWMCGAAHSRSNAVSVRLRLPVPAAKGNQLKVNEACACAVVVHVENGHSLIACSALAMMAHRRRFVRAAASLSLRTHA